MRKFRVLRGLLAPRDATSAEERIEASFNQLMRAATQATDRGDAATSVVKLIEAERLVAAMPDWRKRQVLNVLVVELSRAGGEQTLQRLLQADDTAGRKTRLSPETLVRIGHRARAISRFEDKAREALAELESGTPNAHFPAMQLERAICGLADAGEMDLANAWLDRGLDQGKSWHLMAGGAFSSAVFASIAKAVARVQGRAAALTLVKLAGEHANADRKSGWRTAAIRANAELLIELSPPEEAVELARKVRSKPAKSRLLAKIFATREDWDGLHEVLNACVKPLDAAELIWWTKFVWRPYP